MGKHTISPELLCPICHKQYQKQKMQKHANVRTRHHVFPQIWYGPNGITVYMCFDCHIYGFDKIFYMDLSGQPWLPSECVQNLVKFCKYHGKDAYAIYPQLRNMEPLY